MLIMILKKKMKKIVSPTCSFDEEQNENEHKNIISDFVMKNVKSMK